MIYNHCSTILKIDTWLSIAKPLIHVQIQNWVTTSHGSDGWVFKEYGCNNVSFAIDSARDGVNVNSSH